MTRTVFFCIAEEAKPFIRKALSEFSTDPEDPPFLYYLVESKVCPSMGQGFRMGLQDGKPFESDFINASKAGSYIASHPSRVTVSRYLELFRESESNQTYLLRHEDAKDIRRDTDIRHTVITTWQISFEQIRRDRPTATELLALMSMFERHGIPEDLVRADINELQFEDAVAPLISYSLVRFELEPASFDMHRLVQLSVRTWLGIHAELPRWQKKSRAIMAQVFPSGRYENWTECQRLLPHAKEVMKSISDENEDQQHVAKISSRYGWYSLLRGAYDEAEVMQRRALDTREKALGREHPHTLVSVNMLGLALSSQGRYQEAEAMHRRALAAQENSLGRKYSSTFSSVSNLANVLNSQGKYEEAEAMHRRALETGEKVLGRENPDRLISVNNLGLVLGSQGKYEEAEAIHRRALEAREKVLGREHPDTLTSVNSLGNVLYSQRKYEEAEAMHRRVLEAREKALGSDHPDTLASVSNLGIVLNSGGKFEESEAMLQQVLDAQEEIVGSDYPGTLASVYNLGIVLSSQGKLEEAEAKYRRVLQAIEKSPGHEHMFTVITINSLGNMLFSQGRYEEAEVMHQRALDARVFRDCGGQLGGGSNFSCRVLCCIIVQVYRKESLERDCSNRLQLHETNYIGTALLSATVKIVASQACHRRHHFFSV